MRSDAFDQQRELRMKEGWRGEERVAGGKEKDLGMRVVLRMAMMMVMTGGDGNKCDDDDDNNKDASGGGNDDHSNGDDYRGSDKLETKL